MFYRAYLSVYWNNEIGIGVRSDNLKELEKRGIHFCNGSPASELIENHEHGPENTQIPTAILGEFKSCFRDTHLQG